MGGEQPGGQEGEGLGLPPRDVDAGFDGDVQAAEDRFPGDPGQRLPGQASVHQALERGPVGGGPDEFVGLVGGGHTAGAEQRGGDRRHHPRIPDRVVHRSMLLCLLETAGRRPGASG